MGAHRLMRRTEEERGGGDASRWSRIDTGLCAALALAALAVRLPELLTLPAFRDELAEVVRGLHIYRGLSYPLTNEALDIGAFFNYVVALLFAGAGPDPYTPRLLVTIFGAATVALTYALARVLTGARLPALLAGAFLATNSMHILVGHVAWSNCMTPFWTTATLLALAAGRGRTPDGLPGPRALLVAGLCAGLALQTHSSVVVFLVGVGAWLWWPGPALRRRLRRPAFWGFHGMFLLAYANMIVFNILNPLASWYHVVEHKGYALAGAAPGSETVAVGAGYPDNLLALLVEWVRANSADTVRYDSVARYLADPQMIIYGALLVAGAVLAVRRRYWLVLVPIVSGVLIMPLFNRDYQFEIHTRYIGFLLPLGAILTALPIAAAGARIRAGQLRLRPQAAWAGAALAAVLVLYPLPALASYYREEIAAGRSNSGVIATLDALAAMRGGGAVAYTSKLPQAMSIGLGLDVWEIPHVELINDNDPALPPGAGGLDTPAVWRAFVDWAGQLPPGTREFTVALPPAAVDSWRAIGGDLPWSAPVTVSGSDGTPAATLLHLPLSAAGLAAPAARLQTDLLVIVPRLADALAPATRDRLTSALAAGRSVRVLALTGAEDPGFAGARAALAALGLPDDHVMWGGYPVAFLRRLAPDSGVADPEAPWTDPATGATQAGTAAAPTVHARFFGAPAPLQAAALRADLRAAAVLYTPGAILAPPGDNPDPVALVTGRTAAYAARKAGVPLEILPASAAGR
jgi:hypothetical protein